MIGLFDSGIGGLTVLREVMQRLPNYSLMYFGDTARTPYGNKSAEVVAEYGLEAARFLIERGAQVIVVACNTVSAVGLEAIRRAYPSIPVFDVITPAVGAISRLALKRRSVGVMGTRALVASGVYQRLLKERSSYRVIAQPAPLLVPLVEEGWLDKPETKRIVKSYLTPFKRAQIEALVLACTHYPLLKPILRPRLGRQIHLVDPAEETAQSVAEWVRQHPELVPSAQPPEYRFFVTDLTPNTQAIAERWLRRKLRLDKIHLT